MATVARTALRRMGNSTGMIVPKAVLAEMGAREGEAFDVSVENGRLVAAPAGHLFEGETVSAAEARELAALAEMLREAATRMEARLEDASAAMRAALDPERERALRERLEHELAGAGDGLIEALSR